MTDQKQTSIVVRKNTEVSTQPQFGHRLVSRAADDAIGFLPSPENVTKHKKSIKFFTFDFGQLAAIDGSVGMLWTMDDVWAPPGGSAKFRDAVVTDEGSTEIPDDEVESTLLALGAPMPSFLANEQTNLSQRTSEFKYKTYEDGSTYFGEWKDNLRHGQGTMAGSDGGNYVGEWKNGQQHGYGTRNDTVRCIKYVGEWKDGMKHGQGTTIDSADTKYSGGWKDGHRHGQGTVTFTDGSISIGEWKKGVFIEK